MNRPLGTAVTAKSTPIGAETARSLNSSLIRWIKNSGPETYVNEREQRWV